MSKVQLSLNAQKLPNVAGAFHGKSDPYAVVRMVSASGGAPVEIGKTEVIKNNLSPSWSKQFVFDYSLGVQMHVSVTVYDEISKGKDKPMGSAMFEIGEVLGAKGNAKGKRMKGGGVIFAHVQKYHGKGSLRLQMRAIKLKNTEGVFAKSDPFYEVAKAGNIGGGGSGWVVAFRSKPVMDNLNPVWPDSIVDMFAICNGDQSHPIQISVFDFEKSGRHVLMGSFQTTVGNLIAAKNLGGLGDVNSADLSNAFTLTKKKRETGQMIVLRADLSGMEDENLSQEMAAATISEAPAPPPAVSVPAVHAPTPSAPTMAYVPAPSAPTAAYVPAPSAPTAAYVPAQPAPPAAYVPAPTAAYVPSPSAPAAFVPAPTPHTPAAFVPPGSAPPAYAPPSENTSLFVPPPPPPSFLDYISGGCELNLCVAIDYSSSNGDPRSPGTPHNFTDAGMNDYENAISAIGTVLAQYDTDKSFPVWGFGAKYGGIIRHCFQCGQEAEVQGIDGILRAYRSTFKTGLAMSEPTVITEILKTASARANKRQEEASQRGEQAYTVLLILTDGKITDINATAAVLGEISDSPMSVVLVGIGHGEFSGMEYLDNTAYKRDIAQFVAFNKHRGNKESLRSATLDEIPDQLVGYFTAHGIMPNPPTVQSNDDVMIDPYVEGQEGGDIVF